MTTFCRGERVYVSDDGLRANYSGIGTIDEKCRDADYWRVTFEEPQTRSGNTVSSFEFHSDRLTHAPIVDPTLKPTNPKDAIGSDKLPLHLWPETATITGCLGLLDGALKYGRNNWRETGVRATIYIDAVKRHINAYAEGEDTDPESGMPHLAHALACLAILVDAEAAGKLNDDRNYPGGYRALVNELTPLVAAAKAKHSDKSPKHWTIADTKEVSQ